MVDTTGTTTYGYDDLYRLTAVTYQSGDAQSYTYDAMGNRSTKVNNGATTNYTYDDADEMTAAAGVTYTYDNNGNQVASGSDTYSWDGENRLTSTSIGGVTGTYTYNGAGARMTRSIGGASVTYVWDLTGNLPNVLQDSDGNSYVYGLDLISKTDSGGAQEYYLTDGLGSTTGITDGAGTVTGTYTYDVFGAVRAQTGATTEWNYTGEQHDATGLEFLRARYYDSANGRFVSRDPLPLMQRYAYANNNPSNLVDPSGLVAGGKVAHDIYEWARMVLADPCWKKFIHCSVPKIVGASKKVVQGARAGAYGPLEAVSVGLYARY